MNSGFVDISHCFTSLFAFREILRVIDSLQLTAQKKVATPVDWQVRKLEIVFAPGLLF